MVLSNEAAIRNNISQRTPIHEYIYIYTEEKYVLRKKDDEKEEGGVGPGSRAESRVQIVGIREYKAAVAQLHLPIAPIVDIWSLWPVHFI